MTLEIFVLKTPLSHVNTFLNIAEIHGIFDFEKTK